MSGPRPPSAHAIISVPTIIHPCAFDMGSIPQLTQVLPGWLYVLSKDHRAISLCFEAEHVGHGSPA